MSVYIIDSLNARKCIDGDRTIHCVDLKLIDRLRSNVALKPELLWVPAV